MQRGYAGGRGRRGADVDDELAAVGVRGRSYWRAVRLTRRLSRLRVLGCAGVDLRKIFFEDFVPLSQREARRGRGLDRQAVPSRSRA